MKFLADENFPGPAVKALREAKLDVTWVCEDQAGADDEEVLRRCATEDRVLLTFDKDFGELAFRRGLSAGSGIVLFRVIPHTPEEFAQLSVIAVSSQATWAGHFSVVTRNRIRMTPLPPLPKTSGS